MIAGKLGTHKDVIHARGTVIFCLLQCSKGLRKPHRSFGFLHLFADAVDVRQGEGAYYLCCFGAALAWIMKMRKPKAGSHRAWVSADEVEGELEEQQEEFVEPTREEEEAGLRRVREWLESSAVREDMLEAMML